MKALDKRRVDYLTDNRDAETALLGMLGFSTKLICKRTGLTASQVTYRLNKIGVRRKDYRDGKSPIATVVLDKSRSYVTKQVEAEAKRLLNSKKG